MQKESPGPNIRKAEAEISIYIDQAATNEEVAIGLARLKSAFPKMELPFFNLLAERLKENNFSGERLKDSVNHVIDNFQYKELNVSDIVRFDRKAKLYTYKEASIMVTERLCDFEDFQTMEIKGARYWIMKKDIDL